MITALTVPSSLPHTYGRMFHPRSRIVVRAYEGNYKVITLLRLCSSVTVRKRGIELSDTFVIPKCSNHIVYSHPVVVQYDFMDFIGYSFICGGVCRFLTLRTNCLQHFFSYTTAYNDRQYLTFKLHSRLESNK